jgi:alkylation response protein AidB-like acyl-CoA dehydrogenase
MAADYQAPPTTPSCSARRSALDIVARATGGELTADGADVIAGAGEFAASVLAPLQSIGDREGARLVDGQVRLPDGFAEAYAAFVEAGWISAEAPTSAGGDGFPGRSARASARSGTPRTPRSRCAGCSRPARSTRWMPRHPTRSARPT